MLAGMGAADDRFRRLCLLVKWWAKTRGINDASTGTMNSYAYSLLVLFFLQVLSLLALLVPKYPY
jgi:DNA polymerase sigma